jgi:hypothetical protein
VPEPLDRRVDEPGDLGDFGQVTLVGHRLDAPGLQLSDDLPGLLSATRAVVVHHTTTFAPSSASDSANNLPRFAEPPVTIATLPVWIPLMSGSLFPCSASRLVHPFL